MPIRLFIIAAAVLLGIAVFCIATATQVATIGALGWAIFGLFAWSLDVVFGGYAFTTGRRQPPQQ